LGGEAAVVVCLGGEAAVVVVSVAFFDELEGAGAALATGDLVGVADDEDDGDDEELATAGGGFLQLLRPREALGTSATG
jgi:hypothetical protein